MDLTRLEMGTVDFGCPFGPNRNASTNKEQTPSPDEAIHHALWLSIPRVQLVDVVFGNPGIAELRLSHGGVNFCEAWIIARITSMSTPDLCDITFRPDAVKDGQCNNVSHIARVAMAVQYQNLCTIGTHQRHES